MKKLLMVLALVLFTATSVLAQTTFQSTDITLTSRTNGTIEDTIVNTANRLIAFPIVTGGYPQYYDVASVSASLTRISGTAAGVARWMASNDGVNFFRIQRTDSIIVTNLATQAVGFSTAPYAYKYLGISYTGSGTMSVKMRASAVLKRRK